MRPAADIGGMVDELKRKYLIPNWREVARYAWSVRAMVLAAILTGGMVALPLVAPLVPREWIAAYAAFTFLVCVAAVLCRFKRQPEVSG